VILVDANLPLYAYHPQADQQEKSRARLEALCRNISPALAAAPIKARQACFRLVTEDGLPLTGSAPGIDGAYVATGHSVWGMLNAPVTGEAMSELILDGLAHRVDLALVAPGRLPPLDPVRLRGPSDLRVSSANRAASGAQARRAQARSSGRG
jgi:glycine/D-amino acid oxidase-like deaminating enzyme